MRFSIGFSVRFSLVFHCFSIDFLLILSTQAGTCRCPTSERMATIIASARPLRWAGWARYEMQQKQFLSTFLWNFLLKCSDTVELPLKNDDFAF